MSNIAGQGGANYFDTPVFNATVPKEGPKAMAIQAPFSASISTFSIDLTLSQTQQYMSVVQGVFIDNSANSDTVTLVTGGGTNQTIVFPAGSQGYIPILASRPTSFQVASNGQVTVNFIFLNVPVPAIIWPYPTESGGGGGVADGTYNSTLPTLTAGETQSVQLDSRGRLITLDGSDGPVSPGTAAGFSTLIGGVYNGTAPTVTTGEQVALQTDNNGNLRIYAVGGSITTSQTKSDGVLTSTVTVGTTAVELYAGSGSTTGVLLLNSGSTPCYIGYTSAVSGASNGFLLPAGYSFNADGYDAALYAICASGSTTISVAGFYV